jgi:hypothetical protein
MQPSARIVQTLTTQLTETTHARFIVHYVGGAERATFNPHAALAGTDDRQTTKLHAPYIEGRLSVGGTVYVDVTCCFQATFDDPLLNQFAARISPWIDCDDDDERIAAFCQQHLQGECAADSADVCVYS